MPTGDISNTAIDWLSAAVTDSVHTAAGSGAGDLMPDVAWMIEMIRVGNHVGAQARENVRRASDPSRGIGSSKRAASSAGVCGVDTRPSRLRVCAKFHKGRRLKIGRQGMVGHVAATGEMHYAKDVSVDPYYVACELATRSSVALPLKMRGEVIGVLAVDHRERSAFSAEQLQVFQALVGHITVAIENARMFQRERTEKPPGDAARGR